MPHRPVPLLVLLAAAAAPAAAQLIAIKTVPVAQGDQFAIFPSDNAALGGVSIALPDTLLDPFGNPATGSRVVTGRFFGSPTLFSVSHDAGGGRTLPHLPLALVRSRAEIHARIERRLSTMLGAGLEAEARLLHDAGFSPQDPGIDSIGTREWWPYFEGRRSREDTIAEILASTRAYAKRQETWFRHQGDYRPSEPVLEAVLEAWRSYREKDGG